MIQQADIQSERRAGANERDNRRYVDIHCHCLPGIDDGPSAITEALDLCRALTADGIGTVAATPHQLGRFDNCNDAGEIRNLVRMLNEELRNERIDLDVVPGGDVRVDERLCELLRCDKVMTLGDGGHFVLLELPGEVWIDIEPLLTELEQMNIEAIISHPERCPAIVRQQQALEEWFDCSAALQVTAGSLLGQFGPQAQEAARLYLERGWAEIVATDAHDVCQRRPRMTEAFEYITSEFGLRRARQVCIENPARILRSQGLSGKYRVSAMGTSKWGHQ